MRHGFWVRVIALWSAVTLAVGVSTASADELVIGFGINKPPYVFAEGFDPNVDKRGIELDIVRAVLAETGETLVVRYLPYNRLDKKLAAKEIDGAATLTPGLPGVYYSDAYVYFHNFAITRLADAAPVRILEDLKGRSVIGWQEAQNNLGPTFQSLIPDMSAYAEQPNQKTQVEMFLKGRYDVIVIDRAIFVHWAQELGYDAAQFDYGPVLGDRTYYGVGFHDPQVRDRFNDGLRLFRASPAYEAIYLSYGAP